MNRRLRAVAVAFKRKRGQVALDQIRAVDRRRLVRGSGSLPAARGRSVSELLLEMFARV